MADDYTVTTQQQTIQVLPSGRVIDVEAVGFVTSPSGVHSQVLVPLKDWLAGKAADYIEPLARGIEHLIQGGLASYATFVQEVDPQTRQLADAMEFTVSYTSAGALEPMTTTVRVPIAAIAANPDGDPTLLLTQAHDALQVTAAH